MGICWLVLLTLFLLLLIVYFLNCVVACCVVYIGVVCYVDLAPACSFALCSLIWFRCLFPAGYCGCVVALLLGVDLLLVLLCVCYCDVCGGIVTRVLLCCFYMLVCDCLLLALGDLFVKLG